MIGLRLWASPAAAFGWLLILVLLIVAAVRQGPVFDASIMALLPEARQQPQVQQASEQLAARYARQLLILVSAADSKQARAGTAALAGQLEALDIVAGVRWQLDSATLAQQRQQQFRQRFSVLDDATRARLQQQDYAQLQNQALAQLFSPLSNGTGNLLQDPFALTGHASVNALRTLNIRPEQGMLRVTTASQPTWLLQVELAGTAFNPAIQQRLLAQISMFEQQPQWQLLQLQLSGLLVHAAAGAEQARAEMTTIGVGSLVGIVLLMLLVFRQLRPLLLLLLPLAVGCLAATAGTLLIFGRLHLITLAFGAGLVGVSVDYALHFLCERQRGNPFSALRRLLPGLALGLISSLLAYGAQALAPFPGLRQMACFSVIGLLASWLTVVLWLPRFTRSDSDAAVRAARQLDRWRQRIPDLQQHRYARSLLVVLSAVAVVLLLQGRGSDDIRLLQTSPASLLAAERDVQTLLGQGSSARFLLLSADNFEQLLQQEEQLQPLLNTLITEGRLGGYQALSQLLPSLQRQQQTRQQVAQLYQQALPALFARLQLSADKLEQAQQIFARDSQQLLLPHPWLHQPLNQPWQGLIVEHSTERVTTVLQLTGQLDASAQAQLIALAAGHDRLWFVDRIDSLSQLLADYRAEMAGWVGLAWLLILALLTLRYKRQVWQVVAPALCASVLTLALVMQLEGGINLFHLMALLLVLGVGLDMGIFLTETAASAQTWLAVSLSAITSLLAFGLLALSKTPVLHHFGLTVLIGLTLVWLLTAMMQRPFVCEQKATGTGEVSL